jgi:hypothetical protein
MATRRWRLGGAAGLALSLGLLLAPAQVLPQPTSAAAMALLGQYQSLDEPLRHNAFGRPLVLQSRETDQDLQGEIYALMPYPFATVSRTLRDPQQWCELMILHINTKYCHPASGPQGALLMLNIGSKSPQPLALTTRLLLQYRVPVSEPDYLTVLLSAGDGALADNNFHLGVEAVALPGQQTFIHLSYAYRANLAGRLALQVYLATTGRDKRGFSQQSPRGAAQPVLIDGLRALVERNTMRYYLAIDSYLASEQREPAQRLEARLQSWFSAVEAYPRQLHELDRPTYLAMKRAEYLRQQTLQ